MGDTFTCRSCAAAEQRMLAKVNEPRPDPLAGIPAELQAKMRDPAWRAAFNAPLTPSRALAAGMPPVEVLALMLSRWMKVAPVRRQGLIRELRRWFRAEQEGKALDLLEALEVVIAAADGQAQERP
jgi:hypothetical protein